MGLGVGFTPFETRTEVIARVTDHAEEIGLDRVDVAEGWTHDSLIVLAELAARTSRIGLGSSIISVWGRTPATMALGAAGLQRLSEGRFSLGIGAGSPPLAEGFHGVKWERPLSSPARDVDRGSRAPGRRSPAGARGGCPAPAPGCRAGAAGADRARRSGTGLDPAGRRGRRRLGAVSLGPIPHRRWQSAPAGGRGPCRGAHADRCLARRSGGAGARRGERPAACGLVAVDVPHADGPALSAHARRALRNERCGEGGRRGRGPARRNPNCRRPPRNSLRT